MLQLLIKLIILEIRFKIS